MLRSVASKVTWMARATTTVVGLAIMLALVFGVATTAMGANGQNFILGKAKNAATAVTGLVGNVNGSAMQVVNNNAGTNDTALDLRVQAGEAPMRVNSQTKVANLNADKLDGKSESDFALAIHDHDSRYYTETEVYTKAEVDTALSGKANTSHQHSGADINSGEVADARIAQSLTRDTEVMSRVQASDGAGSGLDADRFDGKDSMDFLQGRGSMVREARAMSPGTSSFLFSSLDTFELRFVCPSTLTNNGTVVFYNNTPTQANLFSDNGDTNPVYRSLSAAFTGNDGYSQGTAASGERITFQMQSGNGKFAMVWFSSVNRSGSNDCHIQAQALIAD